MTDLQAIASLYEEIDNALESLRGTLPATCNGADPIPRKQQINDQAYFVLAWGQLEADITDTCRDTIRKAQQDDDWETCRAWALYDPEGRRPPRLTFENQLSLVLERDSDGWQKAMQFYRVRNQVAHGELLSERNRRIQCHSAVSGHPGSNAPPLTSQKTAASGCARGNTGTLSAASRTYGRYRSSHFTVHRLAGRAGICLPIVHLPAQSSFKTLENSVEPGVHRSLKAVKPATHAALQRIKACIEPVRTLIDPVEALLDPVKAPHQTVESLLRPGFGRIRKQQLRADEDADNHDQVREIKLDEIVHFSPRSATAAPAPVLS